ncbi:MULTISPECIES: SDR family NAD(P)-dependent oxidoreductase [Chryseobacterium]|uniref:Short-subunit dehydrogenase n=1 Tax=Chryseobacterium camelliae TaxID=1265445 RepID=A0ABU0TKL3_9FLAO|nr:MULTISPECIES: SDR family NAD(P)-dependent oxidoreductase [Chryseobacterium]MDT3409306.1 short-subunit dehydrogenase [Pseudacidovorax intermedius]MDQ1096830.1 short-subunit dehydrogenase [Chryseobacterium camelliae]MDQ1100771.1 short-subunit dehydrogenase [Chryseobacterium sp. SORGH_AS_1048]MDR6084215.1 short-subunit dehydrogenase [Chryseobacterium sp. SORGH_AS_0909]MDR6132485.1 short-subunit dehydrogenase [Chryseobacterium sp. SORGH_AS_1175]
MKSEDISGKSLSGKTVVITGGTSGVGRATVEAFALEGCHIVVAARGKEALDETVALCRDLEVAVIGVPTDVSVAEEVENLVQTALQFNGRIDIWVNNAGVMSSGKFEEIPMEVNEQVIKTNLFGYMHGAYSVLPVFKRQQEGVLINNISIGGFMPAPYSAVYSSTKFGIRGMMECLQGEISDFADIHICNIYPQIQRSTGNMHSAKYSGLDFKIPPFAADPRDTAASIVKLAKNPKKEKFPDATSLFLKTVYGLFPKPVINVASAGMRLMMKIKNAPDDNGNVLQPSQEPHRIYGETILPVPSRKTKIALLAGLGLGIAYMLMKKNSGSEETCD